MHYSLHVTDACNLSCAYCGRKKPPISMSRETAHQAVDLALADPDSSIGIGFFGGEPLLCKDLITDIVAYTNANAPAAKKISYRLTTNGLLLDDTFLNYARREGILISISLDGHKEAHDTNRQTHAGQGSYDAILPILPKLLNHNPYTAALMTVAPNTTTFLADSVRSIYAQGFVNIICTLDYSAPWTENDLATLNKNYRKLADTYYEFTLSEKKFFFSPFDGKIDSHVNREEYCAERCKLGFEQISVGTDGTLYPCTQFVDDKDYQIGDVAAGIDQQRRQEIYDLSRAEHPQCRECALRDRCLHTCSCVNKYTTGHITEPSPVLCAVERMLIPIVDNVAARLYKKRSGMFIQKHYNELYPLVSLIEDAGETTRYEDKKTQNMNPEV
ncbi:MAG: SPASM domain-containing protein [Peptococcaceae bacterium]|nr:SPASM domain-containing protein [Peptococcaceae bacterium]